MNPERHAASHWDYYQSLMRGDEEDAEAPRRFYDEYNAVLDMDAEYYLDTIRVVFRGIPPRRRHKGCSRRACAAAGHQEDRPVHD